MTTTLSTTRRVGILAGWGRLPLTVAVFLLTHLAFLSADETRTELSPTTSDPILVDLKTTVAAEWLPEYFGGGRPEALTLRIAIHVRGMAAQHASEFGEIALDSVVSQDGKSYRQACDVYRGNDMQELYRKINADYLDAQGFRFDLDIPNRPPILSFREIRGSLSLQTGGKFEKVVIQNAFRTWGEFSDGEDVSHIDVLNGEIQWIAIPLKDKLLEGLNIKVATKRLAIDKSREGIVYDNVVIQVQSDDPIVDCDILDAKGHPMVYGCYALSGGHPLGRFEFETAEKISPDARLQLIFHRNSRKVRVPFVFNNIKITPQPKEGDSVTTSETVFRRQTR